MGYKVTARLKVDLSDLGEDQNGTPFFVEIQHPRLLTWNQKMEAAKFQIPKDAVLSPEEIKEKAKQMQEFVKSFVKAWNLLDMDTEQPVPVNAENAFDRVPGEVIERILKTFQENSAKQDEDTKNS